VGKIDGGNRMWKIDKGSTTGTTTSDYASALDWQTPELAKKTILLKNTHASLSLKYKLSGYVAEGGVERELVAETTLLAGDVAEFHYDRQWHRLLLQAKNGSGAAIYQVDYEGQGA
jgi:hypothetical protein